MEAGQVLQLQRTETHPGFGRFIFEPLWLSWLHVLYVGAPQFIKRVKNVDKVGQRTSVRLWLEGVCILGIYVRKTIRRIGISEEFGVAMKSENTAITSITFEISYVKPMCLLCILVAPKTSNRSLASEFLNARRQGRVRLDSWRPGLQRQFESFCSQQLSPAYPIARKKPSSK